MAKFPLNLARDHVIILTATLIGPERSHAIQLILDTGATYTMVSPEILVRIGCDPSRYLEKSAITTASGIEYVPFITIPTVRALGSDQHEVKVVAHGLPPNIPARGLLGLNFLRHFNVHLNFLDEEVEVIAARKGTKRRAQS